MRRFGLAHELVGADVLVVSEAASFVTGHARAAHGGFLVNGVNL